MNAGARRRMAGAPMSQDASASRTGRRIGARLGQRGPRLARRAGLAETRGRRWAGPLVALAAFLPGGASTAVYAAAGWTGLPLLMFVLWDTLGSAAWISVVAF